MEKIERFGKNFGMGIAGIISGYGLNTLLNIDPSLTWKLGLSASAILIWGLTITQRNKEYTPEEYHGGLIRDVQKAATEASRHDQLPALFQALAGGVLGGNSQAIIHNILSSL